jgi:non-homologous end joining protein Ku
LYPAISAAERVSFRQVNKQTGNRLRHQLVDAVTGEPVAREDKERGYEVGENQFLLLKDEELETAQQVARTLPLCRNVINLMEALRRRIGAEVLATKSDARKPPAAKRAAPTKRSARRRPI